MAKLLNLLSVTLVLVSFEQLKKNAKILVSSLTVSTTPRSRPSNDIPSCLPKNPTVRSATWSTFLSTSCGPQKRLRTNRRRPQVPELLRSKQVSKSSLSSGL
jgi:hypothetical protein